MSFIPKETIEDLRNQSSISQVIGNYIPLVKKGSSFVAVCPFHDDHDPSLSISEDKQIFKCFVCGVGGNVFSFVEKYKKISRQEAIVEVAKLTNYPLNFDYSRPKIVSKYQKLYDLLNEAIGFSNYAIYSENGKVAYDYLNDRGLNQEIIDHFSIGYNGPKDILHRHLKAKGYPNNLMIKTNVCRISDFGIKDVFSNRVIFPIHDKTGNPIGFSGRTLINDDSKYVNTSQTVLYTKGDVVYNYHRAKESARQSGRIYLVEGVMDVIAMYRAGYENAVCSLGTAITNNQLKVIKELSSNIVINYDGDNAGKNATMKAAKLAINMGFNVSIINNKTKKDPDEIVNKDGVKVLKDIVAQEYSLIEFAFDYFDHGLNTYADRKEYATKVGHLIDALTDEKDRINFEYMLFEKTKIHRNQKNIKVNNKISYNKENYIDDIATNGLIKAEYNILNQMMISNKACEDYKNKLGYLIDDNHLKIAAMIIEQYHKYGNFNYARFCDSTDNQQLIDIVSDIGARELMIGTYDKNLLDDSFEMIKYELLKINRRRILKEIKEFEHTDTEKTIKLIKELADINRKLGGYHGQERK